MCYVIKLTCMECKRAFNWNPSVEEIRPVLCVVCHWNSGGDNLFNRMIDCLE